MDTVVSGHQHATKRGSVLMTQPKNHEEADAAKTFFEVHQVGEDGCCGGRESDSAGG